MISNHNIKSVISYAKSEGLKIDFADFLRQAENHPNYPDILAISDTLSFYNIENGAIQVSASEIDLLPDRFGTFLNKENNISELYFVERQDNDYFYNTENKACAISKSELESRWTNLVLLVAKDSQIKKGETNINAQKALMMIILFCLIL